MQLTHCLVTAFEIIFSMCTGIWNHMLVKLIIEAAFVHRKSELIQQAACFLMLSRYFKMFIYKCTKYN